MAPSLPSSRSRHHPSHYLDICYLHVGYSCCCHMLPGHLIRSSTSGSCSRVGEVGMELGQALWPCLLPSCFALFLNLLPGPGVSPFMLSLPQAQKKLSLLLSPVLPFPAFFLLTCTSCWIHDTRSNIFCCLCVRDSSE